MPRRRGRRVLVSGEGCAAQMSLPELEHVEIDVRPGCGDFGHDQTCVGQWRGERTIGAAIADGGQHPRGVKDIAGRPHQGREDAAGCDSRYQVTVDRLKRSLQQGRCFAVERVAQIILQRQRKNCSPNPENGPIFGLMPTRFGESLDFLESALHIHFARIPSSFTPQGQYLDALRYFASNRLVTRTNAQPWKVVIPLHA